MLHKHKKQQCLLNGPVYRVLHLCGGVSLGGIVAQQVASRCHNWPSTMQPDMVFLGASSNRIDKVATTGEMAEILGLGTALTTAGWTPD